MSRRRSWIVLALVVAAIVGLVVWQRVTAPPPPLPFVTAAITRGDIAEAITANGVLNPIRVVKVGTQVSGTVISLHADFNDQVKAGQVLLRLDPALFASRLAASEANLAQARAQAGLQAANVRRAGDLVARDYISRQEYETLVANSRGAAAQVQAATAQVAQDRANLQFSVIRAPVSGVVISREVDVGTTVAAAFSTPTLFTIARDLARMQIEASVAEADIARVKAGQQVRFTVDAYGSRGFAGVVKQIRLNPVTQQNVVTYTVVVEADNPAGVLLPGMTADARFQLASRNNVLLLPNGALGFRPEGFKPAADLAADEAIVFVDDAGKATARRLRLGASDPLASEILSGPMQAGERVITGLNKPDAAPGMFSGPPGQRARNTRGQDAKAK